jgi:DNA-binding LacI/PurR family transcriptional regulator
MSTSLVRQPAYRIGQEAARVLIDCVKEKKSPRHIVLEAELVERGCSVAHFSMSLRL